MTDELQKRKDAARARKAARLKLRHRVKALRAKRYTIDEIVAEVGIPRGTVATWVNGQERGAAA